MARRSLKPQLNQIRAWVQEGRTDAWIAHQLEISTSELREFRKQHDLTPDDESAGSAEVDLRDEIEAEIEAATVEEVEAEDDEEDEDEGEDEGEAEVDDEDDGDDDGEEPEAEEKPAKRERPKRARKETKSDEGDEKPSGPKKSGRRRRRRGRRGGRGRRKELEATFDHGERDGYGLWFDPAVKDNPVYSEHWAGKREVTVRIDADQIVIRRAGESSDDSND
jgi:hypothetical protein